MPITILIVEDEPITGELLKNLLENEGHQVFLADTAQQGLALAQEVQPDLVLMDIVLPGPMNGLEATRRLKQDPRFWGRIVCQSARSREEDLEAGLAAGADAYLIKPFRRKDILELVARFDSDPRGD